MTPKAQRIAIAKACGWHISEDDADYWWLTNPSGRRLSGKSRNGSKPTLAQSTINLPDYLKSLDAMYEAEKTLVGLLVDSKGKKFITQGYDEYVANLYRVVNGLKPNAYYHWSDLGSNESIVSASAAQRAEAFLKTLDLWT